MREIEVFDGVRAALGESPVWSVADQRLWWVDIFNKTIRWSGSGETGSIVLEEEVGAVFPGERLMAAIGPDIAEVAPDGSCVTVARTGGVPGESRVNDGEVDPDGRIWVGTISLLGDPMDPNNEPAGALYRVDGGEVTTVLTKRPLPNGLAWSPAGDTMYFVDTIAKSISAFDVDPESGMPSAERTHVDVSHLDGTPDGMCLDADGNLWVAFWDGSAVRCYAAADGALLEEVATPVSRPTSCAFGGPDLATLYVTSAAWQREDEPLAGNVLSVDVGVRGLPATPARHAGGVHGGR